MIGAGWAYSQRRPSADVSTEIAEPLFWVLSKLHALTGNWGWAIVLVTVLIKAVFYKLSETSGRSMAKMRKLQPRMKALQERYADDRQELSRKMMELYRSEGANPMAGCLPILVQMPVFFALYWVLIESVELRQAPFVLWIGDLSSRRGVIQGMDDLPGSKAIKAEVPLNEMFGYSTTLRSLTQGRATYTMEFKHYAEAPKNIADSIINKDDKEKK